MIIAEDRFIPLFDTLPSITVDNSDYKPNYDFGSHEDLLRYLNQKAKEGGKIYPLVWVETPINLKGYSKKRGKVKFVLATLSNSELSNRERLEVTIKPTLIPLYNNIITALCQSGFSQILNRNDENYDIHYNYGVKEKDEKKSEATDIWDAIKFECELQLTDECLKKINY
jgi:hypothetical protein